MRGVGGSGDGGAFLLEVFFIFFNCYINMLKLRCNLYLYQMDASSTRNWMKMSKKGSGSLFLKCVTRMAFPVSADFKLSWQTRIGKCFSYSQSPENVRPHSSNSIENAWRDDPIQRHIPSSPLLGSTPPPPGVNDTAIVGKKQFSNIFSNCCVCHAHSPTLNLSTRVCLLDLVVWRRIIIDNLSLALFQLRPVNFWRNGGCKEEHCNWLYWTHCINNAVINVLSNLSFWNQTLKYFTLGIALIWVSAHHLWFRKQRKLEMSGNKHTKMKASNISAKWN